MWTVEQIHELCNRYCGKCGVRFNGTVVINKRLTRTLGQCISIYDPSVEIWYPTRIEISQQLLNTSTDESIKSVIAHECAHYVACKETGEKHGHDALFRSYCNRIGTTNNTPTTAVQRTVPPESIYKYTIYCSKCGKFLGGRQRVCRVTKDSADFRSQCCQGAVRIVQNW